MKLKKFDNEYTRLINHVQSGRRAKLHVHDHVFLTCGYRLWVPSNGGLWREIYNAHYSW